MKANELKDLIARTGNKPLNDKGIDAILSAFAMWDRRNDIAIEAMNGLVSEGDYVFNDISKWAYEIADQMIEQSQRNE